MVIHLYLSGVHKTVYNQKNFISMLDLFNLLIKVVKMSRMIFWRTIKSIQMRSFTLTIF